MTGTPTPRHPAPEPSRSALTQLVQSALGVPGVRAARVGRQRRGGRVVRLALAPGADPGAVADAVTARIAPAPGPVVVLPPAPPAPATPAPAPPVPAPPQAAPPAQARGGRVPVPALASPAVASTPAPRWLDEPAERRPAPTPTAGDRLELRRVQVASEGPDVVVEVVLARGAVLHTGIADGAATVSGTRRAVAGAAARCLESAAGGRLRVDVEDVQVEEVAGAPTAVVALTLVTDHGHEALRGAALADGDAARAVVHAVLAAANRRLAPSLVDHEARAD